ncbi:hypothetical protein BDZ94DRAFT_1259206 [Collybia nuda]|uniref:Uncharacterized protein n=1 Tax=Collybia nuda TaxID=64659 RepID=A0A9P6CIJ7_9AGAR|nr:hypothetical protein BDZ94DRAFT_1259206 [Collybia nuda]
MKGAALNSILIRIQIFPDPRYRSETKVQRQCLENLEFRAGEWPGRGRIPVWCDMTPFYLHHLILQKKYRDGSLSACRIPRPGLPSGSEDDFSSVSGLTGLVPIVQFSYQLKCFLVVVTLDIRMSCRYAKYSRHYFGFDFVVKRRGCRGVGRAWGQK